IFIAATNDILVANFVLQMPSIMPLGLIIFIFSQTLLLSKRFSNAFYEIENLTGKLQENNERLESMVVKRTKALDEANASLSENLKEIQKQNQALDEANKTKNKLFSIIAHDLRNPVAALRNAVDILDPNILNSSELEFIKAELNRQFKGMDFTLSNLLTWAKTQMEEEKLMRENINLTALIAGNEDLYLAMFKEKSLHFVNKVPPDMLVYANIDYLRFILRNLINNAIKFSEIGGTITITASQRVGDIVIAVKDTGVGIGKERQENLFKGNQVTEGTAGEKGTGLGLVLCKEFVEKNGGKIWVESEIGKGSTFYFTLPFGKV
ncbi:MAG: ATP-binding protein, partial [Thermoflexibacter sp.]|nr:ATP-binding protein [Thermoflexibacter sp.]